jgi:hypothetical protein
MVLSVPLSILFLIFPLIDYDTWWHLALGRDILASGAIPRVESFSHTIRGHPWLDFEWLFQVVVYWLQARGGFRALVWARSLLVALVLCLTAANIRREGGGWELSFAGFWTAFILVSTRALVRAEIVTLVFLPLFLLVILSARARRSPRFLLWLPSLTVLWVNLHGGFFLGFGLLFLSMIGVWWEDRAIGRVDGLWRFYGGTLAACLLVSGINPYGYGVVFEVLSLLRMITHSAVAPLISEWNTLKFPEIPTFWILLTVSLLLLAADIARGRKAAYFWAPILPVFGFWASGHVRNPAYFAPVAIPYVFGHFNEGGGGVKRSCVILGLFIAGVYFLGFRKSRLKQTVDWSLLPVRAADFLERENLPGEMYNTWEYGGYLEWRFARRRPVFFDGRSAFVPLLQEQIGTRGSFEAFGRWLDRYGVTYVFIRHADRSIVKDLRGRALDVPRSPWAFFFPRERWALVYWDDAALVFVRRLPMYEKLIRRDESRRVDPDDVDFLLASARRSGKVRKEILEELQRHQRQDGETQTGDILFRLLFAEGH